MNLKMKLNFRKRFGICGGFVGCFDRRRVAPADRVQAKGAYYDVFLRVYGCENVGLRTANHFANTCLLCRNPMYNVNQVGVHIMSMYTV